MKVSNLFLLAVFITCSVSLNAQSKLKLRMYSSKISKKIMKDINPLSGHSCKYLVNEYEYDDQDGSYVLDITTSWTATGCLVCDEAIHQTKSIVGFDRNGNITFLEIYSANQAVINTIAYEEATKRGVEIFDAWLSEK